MNKSFVFDTLDAQKINEAHKVALSKVLSMLKKKLQLHTALDAGCGIGYFSEILHKSGFQVIAFDARQENIEEAKRRNPQINFQVADIENYILRKFWQFDLVLCFGLLYHLENPFLAIRNLCALTKKILILESMCTPNRRIALYLRDEGRSKDQSLRYIAFYPTEKCIIKMLYKAGFSFVYRFIELPEHLEFRNNFFQKKMRTMLVASNTPLDIPLFSFVEEPVDNFNPWKNPWLSSFPTLFSIWYFFHKPLSLKLQILRAKCKYIWNLLFPYLPIPIHLPFGVWWLAWNDVCSDEIFRGTFELNEYHFVEHFLNPGMTVLDIGAHHGFYTLLASKKVGSEGRVIAFEPSFRERKKLILNLRLNSLKNVHIGEFALGSREGEADFFFVKGRDTGCNSLRPPKVSGHTEVFKVRVTTLDNYLNRKKINRIDFLKIDAEGSELEILNGAVDLLQRNPRPVILIEVQDVRTQPFGYRAKEIIIFLACYNYSCFRPLLEGKLEAISKDQEYFNDNLIAIPQERIKEFNISIVSVIK